MDDWDDDWGYNDDAVHNMWVDHTTEVYESDDEDTGWSWMAPASAPAWQRQERSKPRRNSLTDEQKLEKTAANLLLVNEEIDELERLYQSAPSKRKQKKLDDAHMRRRRLIECREQIKRDAQQREQAKRNLEAQRLKFITGCFGMIGLALALWGLWMLCH